MKLNTLPTAKVRFIEPMYARLVNELPEGKEWLYEVKFDGYRCLAGRDEKRVTLWSRRENLFTTQFPHIACACVSPSTSALRGSRSSLPWMKVGGFHLTFCTNSLQNSNYPE